MKFYGLTVEYLVFSGAKLLLFRHGGVGKFWDDSPRRQDLNRHDHMSVFLSHVKQIYAVLHRSDYFRQCGQQRERPLGLAKSPMLILPFLTGIQA
jgi:hypothetical protein